MKQKITQFMALIAIVFVSAWSVNAQTVIFQETFNNLTLDVTADALTSGLTDQADYVIGSGGSAMSCTEAGTMNLYGGRFATKNMDLTGTVKLSVTYKTTTSGLHKRFQIDIDKTGTSGMGGIMNEYADGDPVAPETFTTKEFEITTGTSASYIHFRTESTYNIVIDDIKITKEGDTGLGNNSFENINFNGQTIRNPLHQQLQVFNITGRLVVTSLEDINMKDQVQGIYFVKSDSGILKIALTK